MSARRILFLRHAKSSWDAPESNDHDRPLAPRGRRAAAVMGVFIREEGLAPDLVLCSAARRARETWEIVSAAFAKRPPVEHEEGLYMISPERLLKRLRKAPDEANTLCVVGHEGGVDALARSLSGNGAAALRRRLGEKFPTAALAVVAVDLAHWSDLADGKGTLTVFAAPKDLV